MDPVSGAGNRAAPGGAAGPATVGPGSLLLTSAGGGPEAGSGGAGPWLLGLAALALPLLVVPGAESFAQVKLVAFLALPALALLVSPGRAVSGAAACLGTLPGTVALGLVAWVGWLTNQHSGVPEAGLSLLAAWLLLAWLGTFRDEELEAVVTGPLALATLATALVALVQLAPPAGWSWLLLAGIEQPVGTIGNSNLLAGFLALVVPDLLVPAGRLGALGSALAGGSGLAALAALAACGSRAAWLALAAGLAARVMIPASATSRGQVVPRLGLAMLLALAAPVAVFLQGEAIAGLFGPGKAATVGTRVFGWRLVVEGIEAAGGEPMGPGALAREFPLAKEKLFRAADPERQVELARHARVQREAHHELLEIAFEWGWIGAALALGFLVTVLARALVGLWGMARPGIRARRRAGLATLVGVVLLQGFSFPFQEPASAFVCLLACARALGPWLPAAIPGANAPGPGVFARILGGGLGLLGALVAAVGAACLGLEEAGLSEALHRLAAGDQPAAVAALDRAEAAGAWLRPSPLARVANTRGRLAERSGDLQKALEAFGRAEALEPTWTHAANQGLVLLRQKEPRKAVDAFARAWFRQPEQATAYLLGSALEAAGDASRAEAAWRLGLRLPGFDPRVGYSLGRLLAGTRRAPEAMAVLRVTSETAAAVAPGTPGLADRIRLRIECLKLLLKLAGEAGDTTQAEAATAALKAMDPGFDPAEPGDVGLREVPG